MRNMLRQGLKRLINTNEHEAVGERYASGRREATVIAVSSQKGGVGKTTTSVCLAAALAKFHNKAVLIIDMDAQGHVQKSLASHVTNRGTSLSRVLLSPERADVLDAITNTGVERLHITAADRGLIEAESLMSTKIGKEFILRDALKYTRTHYDFIIIDCPPNLGNLTLNALVAADWVLVPCDASPLAVQGVSDIVHTMATINDRLNRGLDLLGIVLTRIDGRTTTVNQAVVDELKDDFGDLLFTSSIGVNTTISKAQFEGRSLFDFSPDDRAAKQYKQVSDEVVERLSEDVAHVNA
ncbi:MAG: ParA family protein [Myxococcales bacterium]|nr:ParA family protein [Myxococcales bacterium]